MRLLGVCAVASARTAGTTRPSFAFHSPRFSKKSFLPTTRTSTRFMTDEVQEAKQAAASSGETGAPTVFDKILSGEWSSDKVFEDEQCLAFRDVNPQAPVHIVLIPKQRGNLTKLSCASQEEAPLLGHLLYVAQLVGKEHCPRGFRIVINDGEHGSQSVYHLHLHILGGRQMTWPPG